MTPSKTRLKRDISKFCNNHQQREHDIDYYEELYSMVEIILTLGMLRI
jgi:hypothetical protein